MDLQANWKKATIIIVSVVTILHFIIFYSMQNKITIPHLLSFNVSVDMFFRKEKEIVPTLPLPKAGHHGELTNIDIKYDIWIYSVFYLHNKLAHGLRAVALSRIVGRDPTVKPTITLFSQGGKSGSVIGSQRTIGGANLYGEIIIECDLEADQKPIWVSFSWPHNHTQSVKVPVVYPEPWSYRNITLCYSVLFGNFNDAEQLQQNLEFNRLLGVEHVFVYNQSLGQDADVLLRLYIDQGYVTVLPMPAMASQSHYHGQNIAIQDCFARNKESSRYVIVQDPDEYIIPLKHNSLVGLLSELEEHERQQNRMKEVATFSFRHAFHCLTPLSPEQQKIVSGNLSLSQGDVTFLHEHRVKVILKRYRKSFDPFPYRQKSVFRPELVRDPGTHWPKNLEPGTRRLNVDTSIAFLAHYKFCPNCEKKAKGSSKDKHPECTFHFNVSPLYQPLVARLKSASDEFHNFRKQNDLL